MGLLSTRLVAPAAIYHQMWPLNSNLYQMFSEFHPQSISIPRQVSPPPGFIMDRSSSPLTPIVTRIEPVGPPHIFPWRSEIKRPVSIQSTNFGTNELIPLPVSPVAIQSQEQLVDPRMGALNGSSMTQSLGSIPATMVQGSATQFLNRRPPTTATASYLQVRNPQSQYPDYLTDKDATANIQDFQIKPMTDKPLDLINKQVVQTDTSEQEQAVKNLFAGQYEFTDNMFPPDTYRFFGNMDPRDPSYRQRAVHLQWRRFSEVYRNPGIFTGGIRPSNINQGAFGTCYFLVGLAALAEHPQRIRDIFLWEEMSNYRIFALNLFFRGRLKTIYLDDYFPLPRNEYLQKKVYGCAVGSPGQMWVSLLEKGWAKLYGSYHGCEGGFTEEALHDLTGAHMKFIRPRDANFDKEAAWKLLLDGTRDGFAMLAQSPLGNDNEISKSGMVFGHAYTVLGAYEVTTYEQIVRLVKCRNPWATQEWALDWSDTDIRWNSVSAQDKARINFTPNSKDGEFFMDFDDLCDWMMKITIAEIHDGSSYVYCTQPDDMCEGRYFKVHIHKKGWYSFQLSQTPDKLLGEEALRMDFEYPPARLNIGRLTPSGDIQWQRGAYSNNRTIFRKLDLEPGDYIVYGHQQYYRSDPYREVTLSICGQFYCEIAPAPVKDTTNFHTKLLLSRGRDRAKRIVDKVRYIQEILPEEGLIYAAVFNNSDKPITIRLKPCENLNKQVPTVKLHTQTLAPGEEFIVSEKIPNCDQWTSNLCGVELVNSG